MAHPAAQVAGERPSSFGLGELAGVCAQYELGEIRGIYEFPKGSARSPKAVLETSTGRYLLKRRARGRDDPYRVAFAHEVQLFLQGAGFPLARLVGTARGNNSMAQLNGRVYEVFEFVEGQGFDRTPAPAEAAGRLLARLHGLVRGFEPSWPAPAWSYHNDAGVRARVRAVAGRGIEGAAELAALYERASGLASAAPPPPAQLLHGDWHPWNMIFRGGAVAAVLDFDGARTGPCLHDLASGLLQFSLTRVRTDPDDWPDAIDAHRFAAFARGYGPFEGDPAAIAPLMAEALAAEVTTPIAATGAFAGRAPGPFVRMASRKGAWLLENAPKIAALAARSAGGGDSR